MPKRRKVRRLEVTIKSSDRGLPDRTWMLELTETGLRARRKGDREENSVGATWRTILGVLLVHK